MAKENSSKQDDFPAIVETWKPDEAFVKAAKTSDIPAGRMIHVEVEGKEIMIANVEGKFYALCDRCPHMNALLSNGSLNKFTVTCPRHFSSFDVITGKAITGNTHGLQVYDVKVEGNDLLINIY